MAWEHFTDYLAEGELLTAAQYGELLDAIEERIKAINADWGWSATMATIRATGLVTHRVHYTGLDGAGSGGVETTLAGIITQLSSWYSSESASVTTGELWASVDGSGFAALFQAAEDLDYIADASDSSDQTEVLAWLISPLPMARVWNILRRAVQLLVIVAPEPLEVEPFEKLADTGEETIEELQAITETAGSPVSSWFAGADLDPYRLARVQAVLNLDPALYVSYEAWGVVCVLHPFSNDTTVNWTWGSDVTTETYPWSASDPDNQVKSLGTQDASGEVVIKLDTANYFVGGPDRSDAVEAYNELQGFFAAPNFTHPLEALP